MAGIQIDGVNNIIKPDGSAMTIGASGDTVTVASGAKIAFADGGDISRFMVDRWRLTTSLATSDELTIMDQIQVLLEML